LLDVVIVGAGFSGLYGVHRFREAGLSVRGYERAPGVGGTWYWNRYPGARCDIESIYYSYSFSPELEQEWTWSQRYAEQPEILAYLEHVADRFDLRSAFTFNTSVTAAVFDDDSQTWRVSTDGGETVRCRFLVMATGPLSVPSDPQIRGLEAFTGQVLRTSNWPDDVDLTGLRVGIVGTGSSCIQAAPKLADQVGHLSVFQRTPQYAIPAWNRPYEEAEIEKIKAGYRQMRADAWETIGGIIYEQPDHDPLTATVEQRGEWLERTWARGGYLMIASYPNVLYDDRVNAMVGEFVQRKLRTRIKDEKLAERLMPQYPFAAKRLCVDTDYFEIYNRDDVTLVDLRENPLSHADETGFVLEDGTHVDLDVVVLATGFDALTGAIRQVDVRGRGGLRIQDKWATSSKNYLGLTIAGFPNFFAVQGPGSIGVLYNMIPAIEHQIDFIADVVARVDKLGAASIEPTEEAEAEWCEHVNELAEKTVYPRANTWYMGDNVPGKPREFLAYSGGGPAYFQHYKDVAARDYDTFVIRSAAVAAKQ
jgi:cyclohexanone monooxygenase